MGDPIPQRKGTFFWGGGNVAANGTFYGAMCKNGWTDRHAVLDEDSSGPTEPCIRWECRSSKGGAIFGGCPGHSKPLAIFTAAVAATLLIAIAFAASGITQSPIASCSWRNHSVCQGSANSIRKIYGRRRLSAVKGLVRLYSAGEVYTIALFMFVIVYLRCRI